MSNYRVFFQTGPLAVQYQIKTNHAMSQPDLLFHEILHLIGLLAFFYFGSEQGGWWLVKHPVSKVAAVEKEATL